MKLKHRSVSAKDGGGSIKLHPGKAKPLLPSPSIQAETGPTMLLQLRIAGFVCIASSVCPRPHHCAAAGVCLCDVRVSAEVAEDMWHVFNLLAVGDLVQATTVRVLRSLCLFWFRRRTNDCVCVRAGETCGAGRCHWQHQVRARPDDAHHRGGDCGL